MLPGIWSRSEKIIIFRWFYNLFSFKCFGDIQVWGGGAAARGGGAERGAAVGEGAARCRGAEGSGAVLEPGPPPPAAVGPRVGAQYLNLGRRLPWPLGRGEGRGTRTWAAAARGRGAEGGPQPSTTSMLASI